MRVAVGILLVVVLLGLLRDGEAASQCSGKREGHIATTCNIKNSEEEKAKCKNWAKKHLINSISPFTGRDQEYMVRKYDRCSKNGFSKARCCWKKSGDTWKREVQKKGRRLQSDDDESIFECANPVFKESANTWTNLTFYVSGNIANLTGLADGFHSIPFEPVPGADVNPPSACKFIRTNIQRLVAESSDNGEIPTIDVVNLEKPATGMCSLTPFSGACQQFDDPAYCNDLESEHRCSECSVEDCAAVCNGLAPCAGIEYYTGDNSCKLVMHPEYNGFAQFNFITPESEEGEDPPTSDAEFPAFTVGYSLKAPPAIVKGSKNSGATCYGRSSETAIHSKAVEVKTDGGLGGRCKISESANRVQKCGPGFVGLGLCGIPTCASLCTQNALCNAYEYFLDGDEGLCYLIFNETVTTVEQDTSSLYRCFHVERDGVRAEDSDWMNPYRNLGFRDIKGKDGGIGLNLFNLTDNPGVIIRTPTSPPVLTPGFTEMPTTAPTTSGPTSTPFPTTGFTETPTSAPTTLGPTLSPATSMTPTEAPTTAPTTSGPTLSPATSTTPTEMPTTAPAFVDPTLSPTPTTIMLPTDMPTAFPLMESPTPGPAGAPQEELTQAPTIMNATPVPTRSPTPIDEETIGPSNAPTQYPTIVPTQNPTRYKRCSLRRGPDKGCCIKLGKRKFRCCKTYEDVRYCCTGRRKNIPEADQGYEEKFTCCVRYEDDTVECIEKESAKTADDSEPTSEAMNLLQVALSEDDDDDTYYNAYYSDEDYDEGSDADD